MSRSSHFDQARRDWSKRKHAVLTDYLPSFCTALSKKADTIWYVDGYAGAGIYRDPNNPNNPGEPGSPVLAAQETAKLAYNIRCLNIEEDPANFSSLQTETSRFSHVENIFADFNDVIGTVLDRVRGQPAFFFLDPFGVKDLPMQGLVEPIAQRRTQTDILLRYATETVRRLVGSYENDPVRGGANEMHVTHWFRGDGWKAIVQNNAPGIQRDDHLLNYYLQQLVSISGGRFSHAAAYPIRTLQGNIKYHLVFATGNKLGMKLMSEVLYKAEHDYSAEQAIYQENRRSGQVDMFSESEQTQAQTERMSQLEQSILRAGMTKNIWNFHELYYELLLNRGWFAQVSEKEFRATCKTLHAQSKIERLSPRNAWGPTTEIRIPKI